MIFKKKNTSHSYFKLIKVYHAGSLPGKTSGGKSHVINLEYLVDLSRSPPDGVSKIMLSISDRKPRVITPNIKVSSDKRFSESIQSLNANLRSVNSNTAFSSLGFGVSDISLVDKRNLNMSVALLDPFFSRGVQKGNVEKFAAKKSDERDRPTSLSALNSSEVKYGKKNALRLKKAGNSIKKSASPVRVSTEGVAAKVSLGTRFFSNIVDSDIEALTNQGGYARSHDGTYSAASVGDERRSVLLSISDQLKTPGVSNPMDNLIEKAINQVSLGRAFQSPPSNGQSSARAVYSEACFSSIIEDKVDPAKSAIVPPITLSGEGTLTGELPSNKNLEDTRRESKRQISISKNQELIKEENSFISNPRIREMSDIPAESLVLETYQKVDSTGMVSQMIPINSAYASSYNTLYANVQVYSCSGACVQDYDFEIPMRQIISDNNLPSVPPTISSYPLRPGIVGIEVVQNDKNATGVDVYCRNVSRISGKSEKWKKLAELSLNSSQNRVQIEHTPDTGCTILYRAVAKTKEKKSCNFGSTICQSEDVFKKATQEAKVDGSICAIINEDKNIEVTISNIKGGFQHIDLRRRDLTNFEKRFARISFSGDQSGFVNTGGEISFVDTHVEEGHVYEYKAFSTSFDGIGRELFRTAVIEYMSPATDVTLSVKNPTPVKGPRATTANVAIPVSVKFSSDQNSFISEMLSSAGFSKEELSLIPDIINQANQASGVMINRIDQSTGESAYLGFFPTGLESSPIFIDKGDSSVNIPAPVVGRRYKYVFEAVILDLATVVEEAKFRDAGQDYLSSISAELNTQIQRNKNSLKLTNDTTAGLTPDPKNPNRPSKSLNRRTLGRGMDAGVILPPVTSTVQEIELGRTGVYSVVEADLTTRFKPTISRSSCRIRSDGHVVIEWSVRDTKNIDHFLIKESRFGNTRVCLSAHNISNKGKYSIVETGARSMPGSVSYSIVPVGMDYTMGEEHFVGSVVIQPDNIDTITVTKDLPNGLATSNEGSFQNPEI